MADEISERIADLECDGPEVTAPDIESVVARLHVCGRSAHQTDDPDDRTRVKLDIEWRREVRGT